MKKAFYLFSILLVLASCGKKAATYTPPPPPSSLPSANSFSIQGDSFKNSSVSIRNISYQEQNYDPGPGTTYLQVQGTGNSTDSFSTISIAFSFQGNGVTSNAILSGVIISFYNKNQTFFSYAADPSTTVGSVSVTAYGAVGKQITGTFNITGLPNASGTKTVSITNGKFSVTRKN